jgi:hypothetical protein
MIALPFQESSDQLRGVGNETFGVLEDRGHSENSILANVCMSVLEARSRRGEKGFYKLSFTKLAQESKCVASNIFIGMLEIISNSVAGGRLAEMQLTRRN